jgi:hypothetical protein
MNTAKAVSIGDGKRFLRDALAAEQDVLALQLELSAKSITHSGVMGEVNEQHFIDVLRKYLPQRYEVAQGVVIDSNGATSDQIDVIIFDHQYTPTLLDQQAHRFIPAEAVYCVLEVKPTINKHYLDYAAEKAHSVRRLERTSVSIRHAGGEYPPKPLFPIVAGIVATGAEWGEGLAAVAFAENLMAHSDTYLLNCGLAVRDRAFDIYEEKLQISESTGSLATFLFRLIRRLQSLGTVPAVDWDRYGSVLSSDA